MAILGKSVPPPLTEEQKARCDRMLKRLPPGFGPGHPKWHIPSFRNKWLVTQGVIFGDMPPETDRHYGISPNDTDPRHGYD